MPLLRLYDPTNQFQTKSGALNTGGLLLVYLNGTDDLAEVYDDYGTLIPQPVVLDNNGRAQGLMVDSKSLYRLEVYDRNDSLLFTIPNMAPNASGAISSMTVITSDDGSISVERTVNGYDLSANASLPSVMLLRGRTLSNGVFVMDEYESKSGTSIFIDNNFLKVNKGYFHVDARVSISFNGSVENRMQLITLSSTPTSVNKDFDISYQHSESIDLSYDFQAPTDGYVVSIGIAGLVDGMQASMTGVSIHEVKGQSAGQGGSGESYEAGPGINISDSNVISTDITANTLTGATQSPNFGESFSAANGVSSDGHEIKVALDNVQMPNLIAGGGIGIQNSSSPVGKVISVLVGDGLKIDSEGGLSVVTIDSDVSDVVKTVQKLAEDLDKKITTTYSFAQITTMSDFAVFGVTNTSRMIGQLFAVPIASEIRKDETLLCVNALQSFSGNVSFGIFEYDFDGNSGTGSTYWIADTGTVSVRAGENEFPLKYVNNDVHEMQSSKLYYAVIAIAANAPSSGLYLASSPNYSATYNANPKYTIVASNMNNYIDWTTGTLSGAWFQGYNEDNTVPRLFMMLRNGEGSTPITTGPFMDIGDFTLQSQYTVANMFSLTPDTNGAVYRKVIPSQDVDIVSFRYADTNETVLKTSSYPVLLDEAYIPMKSISDGLWTVGDSDQTKIDDTHFVHEFTFSAPVHLTANTAYWFMVAGNLDGQASEPLVTYIAPAVTNDLLLVKNMYNVNSWIIPNSGEFQSQKPGMFLKLSDGTDSWVI